MLERLEVTQPLLKYKGNIYNLQDYPILTIVDSQGLPNAEFTGDVVGDLTGNIKNDIGDTILSNGDSSTSAVFTGDVTGNIKNDIGDTILSNGDSSTPAVFTGDVTGDIKNDLNGDSSICYLQMSPAI